MQTGAIEQRNIISLAQRRRNTSHVTAVYVEIADLLSHPKFVETHSQVHHSVRKSDHLMRSARYAYWIARATGANARVCARAGLLHDLHSRLGTWATHGAIAASVADEIGESPEVCHAIVPHMFPIGPAPRTREGWVLTLADKIATVVDAAHFAARLLTGEGLRERRLLLASDRFIQSEPQKRALSRAA